MSFYSQIGNSGKFTEIADSINAVMASNQFNLASDTIGKLFSMESITVDQTRNSLATTEGDMQRFLREAGLDVAIKDHLGLESVDHACVQNAMDAAALTMLSCYDMAAFQKQHTMKTKASGDVTLLRDDFGRDEIVFEGYDRYDFQDFIGTSVVANALAAASTPAEELFFRTILCSGAQNGADITIRNPQVYTRKTRNAAGTAYDLLKQSIARAYIDSSILEGQNSTKVVPIVKDADANAGVLVAAADIANATTTLGGEEVTVRPFLYGTAIDLISNSARPSLVGAESQDETFTLDPMIKVGTQYISISDDETAPNVAKLKINLDHLPGALLNPVAEGSGKGLSTAFEGYVFVKSTDETIGGSTVGAVLSTLDTDLGLADGSAYTLKLKVRLHATADLTYSNMTVDFVSAVIVSAESEGTAVDDISGVVNGTTIAGLGFWPTATRSNSNMSELGLIVDMSDELKTRLPALMHSPLSIIAPPSAEGGSATVEAVNMVKNITSTNRAVTKLLEARDYIKAASSVLTGSFAIGQSAGIVPTCIEHNLVVEDKISVFGSKQALSDVQGLLSAASQMIVAQMLQQSGYLASLKTFTGVAANYEIVATTDQTLYMLFMIQGENRTLGNGMNFKIEPCLDSRLDGKVIFSVRRTGVTKAEPHSFGCRPLMPSPVHQATPTRGTSTSKEIITVPREGHYVTCPVMAVLNVSGHTNFFSEAVV